jgi:hypothetical protein
MLLDELIVAAIGISGFLPGIQNVPGCPSGSQAALRACVEDLSCRGNTGLVSLTKVVCMARRYGGPSGFTLSRSSAGVGGQLMCCKVLFLTSAMVASVACQTAAGQDKDVREKENGWSSFEKGSWAVFKKAMKIDGKAESSREKEVVAGFEKDCVNVDLLQEVGAKYVERGTAMISYRMAFMASANLFEEGKRPKETVEIAGKKLECMVQEFAFPPKGKSQPFTLKIVVWRANNVKIPYTEIPNDANLAVPSDAVKLQLTFEGQDKRTKKYTGIVESFASELKIGNKDIKCVVLKWNLEDVDPQTGKSVLDARVWLSADVPGCEVKSQANGRYRGQAFEIERIVEDYQAAKRKQ